MVKTTRIRAYVPEEDKLQVWKDLYMEEEIYPERPKDSSQKVNRLLQRFIDFFQERYGHQKVTTVTKRDVEAWLELLYDPKETGGLGFAANYVNDHQTTLSAFFKWLRIKAPYLIYKDPTNKVRDIYVSEPEGRSLSLQQQRSLKNICDRLERFYLKKDRARAAGKMILKDSSRPLRNRAIVYVFLSTGIRREELTKLNLDQLVPSNISELRKSENPKIVKVRGKGKTERTVYLSSDAKKALIEYLEEERQKDVTPGATALFLSPVGRNNRKPDGRLATRTINSILEDIARWHDGEQTDPERKISSLTPHDLRHTFCNNLKHTPGITEQDIINLMGWRNSKQIPRYTKEKDEIYSQYVKEL